jgi:hypothetical protein
MTIYAVYHSPAGSPAALAVQGWWAVPGERRPLGDVIFASSLEAAEAVAKGLSDVPLFWHPRVEGQKGEAKRLIGTWEPRR